MTQSFHHPVKRKRALLESNPPGITGWVRDGMSAGGARLILASQPCFALFQTTDSRAYPMPKKNSFSNRTTHYLRTRKIPFHGEPAQVEQRSMMPKRISSADLPTKSWRPFWRRPSSSPTCPTKRTKSPKERAVCFAVIPDPIRPLPDTIASEPPLLRMWSRTIRPESMGVSGAPPFRVTFPLTPDQFGGAE